VYCGAGQFEPAGTRVSDPAQGIGGYDGKGWIVGEACDDPFQRPGDSGDNGHCAVVDITEHRNNKMNSEAQR